MTEYVEKLVEALRSELQQHGEMLALLDGHETGRQTSLPAALTAFEAVRLQGTVIEEARNRRLQFQSQLAWATGHPQRESVSELLPHLPAQYQPLLSALSDEVNQLAREVHERALRGHARLLAAVGQMETFITSVTPSESDDSKSKIHTITA